MNLLDKFYNKMCSLGVKTNSKILVAASGGMDSMVLLSLSANGHCNVEVAHANFKLRGADSDADENLVRKTAKNLGIKLHTKNLIIDKEIENVQLTARNLRYEWFEELAKKNKIDFILTGHHQNDRIETFFINLLRGSGIKGLKSIPEKNNLIIRPLLHFPKEEIRKYAVSNGIEWREDSSNRKTDYLRNKIRHVLAKNFSELTPTANQNLSKSMDFLTDANDFFENRAVDFIHSLKIDKGNRIISDEQWNYLFGAKPLHKYVLENFGFTTDQLSQLDSLGNSQSGRLVESPYFTIFRDRNSFILEPVESQIACSILIENAHGNLDSPIHLSWHLSQNSEFIPSRDRNVAHLNFGELEFPLLLRNWKPGDRFTPTGMNGSKKISDFLIDQKCSIPQKNKTLVLESGGEICWVVGMRVDDRYKVEDGQDTLFTIKLDA